MKATMLGSAMPPMLFAPAVESNHMFASRWLNIQLFNLGFAKSFMRLFVSNKEWSFQSSASEDSFITFVGDNVDHNIATLDGKETFHGMGVVAAVTNKGNSIAKQSMRVRPKSYTEANELVRKKASRFVTSRPIEA